MRFRIEFEGACKKFYIAFEFNPAAMPEKNLKRYWRTNLSYLAILLSAWVEELNNIRLGGFKLGFWFAQQGSIYAFVIIILIYIRLMNRLDKKYNVNE